jgi:hypothetical protein
VGTLHRVLGDLSADLCLEVIDSFVCHVLCVTLVDASNPIREWMERARSTVELELDEESSETDALIPSAIVTAIADPRDLQRRTRSQFILQ